MGNQRFTFGLAKMKLILNEVIFAEIDFRLSNLLHDKFEKSLEICLFSYFYDNRFLQICLS